ncbi:unnamed protein product, partial [Didymodactylos carnosus]
SKKQIMPSSSREIVTIQVGHYSNYIGAHLWNNFDIESSMNAYNSSFFNINENKCTPRLILFDQRGALKELSNVTDSSSDLSCELDMNTEYIDCSNGNNEKLNYLKEFDNDNKKQEIEPINFEQSIQSWPDFLRTKSTFNPRSSITLQDHWHNDNDNSNEQFDIYHAGVQAYKQQFDQIEETFHYFLEQCDCLQGFRCLCDTNDGFSGLYSNIQDYLYEECPKRPTFTYLSFKPRTNSKHNQTDLINFCLTLTNSLCTNEMPTIPLSLQYPLESSDQKIHFPSFNYDSTSFYQTSFLLSIVIQHSLISSTFTYDMLTDRLCPKKNYLLSLSSLLPFDLNSSSTLLTYLQNRDLFSSLINLTPFIKQKMDNELLACHCFIRGIDQHYLYNPHTTQSTIQFHSASDLIDTYFFEQYSSTMISSSSSWKQKLQFQLPDPFTQLNNSS